MSLLRRARGYEGTFVPGWSVKRVWLLSVALCMAVLLIGLVAAPKVDLSGLLIVGPCCALLTGRWVRTAATGIVALAGALLLAGVAKGASGEERLLFTAAVGLVALLNTLAAVWIERHAADSTPHMEA